jgi:hypothetical protein
VRRGGEEFVLVLPSTDHERAVALAERIRRGVAEPTFDDDAGPPIRKPSRSAWRRRSRAAGAAGSGSFASSHGPPILASHRRASPYVTRRATFGEIGRNRRCPPSGTRLRVAEEGNTPNEGA